jgi:hypothetical protein
MFQRRTVVPDNAEIVQVKSWYAGALCPGLDNTHCRDRIGLCLRI